MTQTVRCFDYINQPYETVRQAVLSDPPALFQQATSAGQGSQLHVRIGALELGAEIVIEVLGVEETREGFERPKTTLALEWRAKRGTSLFPIMLATLAIYPLTPSETQVELDGVYQTPLGIVGHVFDAVALHRFAKMSASGFVREIAAYLRRSLMPGLASA